ncbi:MAG: trigger factor [Candidatus Yanofskybacteria bacterium CG10_big_fil_rev_8_21_14_0_10_37_15]|uniref:Trigger factor n=1 Tax=Candidatus Yanofskybacteria bacterium CG10_big_fil_rev_8_21_14_0_10_37_15 TaxID=1975097 RepID=A0A2H0R623_9BACT|nr:MAG: trigger factor [Candidatus Yanofskybacteria bacterium CG10_big_fil_rev_8_21_14_0_10_37_15]
MTHQFKKIDEFQRELTVELSKDDLKNYVEKTENILGSDLKIDGFRKGKIPKDQFKKHLDSTAVLQSALDLAIQESLTNVIKEEDLDMMSFSKLEVKENTPEKLVYKVLLVLFPEIKIKKDKNFKVEKRNISVEQKEIEDTLNTVRNSRAAYKEKTGPAENGDRVEVDFEVKNDGKLIDGGMSKNHPIILGGKHFIPGFEENLIGMKKGENKVFSLIGPKDYYRKDMAGKKLEFYVQVNNVQSVSLPELNDDFAKMLGKFNSVSDIVNSVKEGLLQEKKIKEQQRVRLEILSHIIKESGISAPEFMVAKQLDSMVQDFDNNLHANGMELGLYLAHAGKTQEDLKKDWKEEAEKQVKIFLILRKITKDENITASREEIDQELNNAIQATLMRGGKVQENLDVERLKEDISGKIINEKTFNFLERLHAD